MLGKKIWIIPDGFIPKDSSGSLVSHEAICLLNLSEKDAKVNLSVYFEDREPIEDFSLESKVKRANHIRLDYIASDSGEKIPLGVPYAMKVESDMPIIVQHSRMDTTQAELTLMSTMAYPVE